MYAFLYSLLLFVCFRFFFLMLAFLFLSSASVLFYVISFLMPL